MSTRFVFAALVGFLLVCGSGLQPATAAGASEVPGGTPSASTTVQTSELSDMPFSSAVDALSEVPASERVRAASELSRLALDDRNFDRAFAWAQFAAEEAAAERLHAQTGHTWLTLALIQDARGELRDAIRSASVSARAFARSGDPLSELEALSIRARLEHRLGALVDGVETASGIIERFGEQPLDERFRADVLSNAAMMNFKLGRLSEVPGLLEAATPLYTALDDSDGLGTVYRIWGNYYGALDEPQEAILYYERAGSRYRETGNIFDAANVYFNTALMLMQVDEYESAVSAFEEAMNGFTRAGSDSGVGMAATELTVALWELERYDEAETMIQSAIALLQASQSLRRLARAYTILGTIYDALGSSDQAVEQLGNARNLYDELGLLDEALNVQREMDRIGPEHRGGGI
ncbi:MAG: tetratricopeptide repeat protein [Spirochaetaceae bacterium]